MAKIIKKRQIEQRKFELRKISKDRLPPNSRYFDLKSTPSRSSIKAQSNKLKEGSITHQKSMKILYNHPKKLLSDKEKQKYNQRFKMQQSQAESNLFYIITA